MTPAQHRVERMTGGKALVAALAAHEVTQVFGIPGTHNLAIYAHLTEYRIAHFLPRHEQGAGYAADGYARATGRPGVCLTTSGPAVLNAAAAIAQAYSDSVPVLLVSPGLSLRHPGLGNGYLHEAKDQGRALDSLVAYSHRVTSVEEIPLAVAQAFTSMRTGRPRPVHLELPLDLLDETAEVQIVPPVLRAVAQPEAKALDRAAAALAGARRPGVIAGGGCTRAATELRTFAETVGAPVITTTNGKGVVPEDHPLSLGAGLQHPTVQGFAADCDVLVAVGTELAPSDLWLGPLHVPGTLVRIDIDGTSVVTNAVPDIAVVGEAALGLEGLLNRLKAHNHAPAQDAHSRAETWRKRIRTEAETEGRAWLPIVEAMAKSLGRAGVVAGDSAMAVYYGALSNLPAYQPASFLYPTGFGTLGYGLPAAIGAKLGRPDARVVAMHGDGGVMFTIAELAGAAQAGLALPVIVVDNAGYGEIRKEMEDRGDSPLAVDLGPPDFPALARSLGCHGVFVSSGPALAEQLEKAFFADRPTLIHVPENLADVADVLPDNATGG